jgi:spore coat polysaccharide biosynthesis predicted glycosyltransferase SpsG
MKNLIFRFDVDRGKFAGTGHFKRIEIIYNFLKKEYSDIKFFFLYKNLDNSQNTLNILTKKNHIIYDKNFEKKLKFFNQDDILICDTPFGIDGKLKKFLIKKKIHKVLLFDDLNKPKIEKCTIVNGIKSFKNKIKSKNFVRVYSGEKYILLNTLYSNKTAKKQDTKFTILLTLGGTDLSNNLYKILIILSKIPKIKIFVIIGSQIKKNNPIFKIKNKRIKFIFNKKNLYKYFCISSISITAGGISMFESVALKKPTLVFQTHEHQKYSIKYLLKNKAIIKIGEKEKIQKNKLYKIINLCIQNKIKLYPNSANIDGMGYHRIIKIIKKIINK